MEAPTVIRRTFVYAVIALIAVGCSEAPRRRTRPTQKPVAQKPAAPSRESVAAIARVKSQTCVLLERLLSFKDKEDFKQYGFGVGGPYHTWLKDVESLKKAQPVGMSHPIPLLVRSAPGDLLMIGMEYSKIRGESQYTRTMLPELKRTIDYAGYLAKQEQRERE